VISYFFPNYLILINDNKDRPRIDDLNGAKKMAGSFTESEEYMPAWKAARSLGLSLLTLARLTSSVKIKTSSVGSIDVGLNLKFEKRGIKSVGFARKSTKGWEYSSKAVKLISDFVVIIFIISSYDY
jgi:hypothetical protein